MPRSLHVLPHPEGWMVKKDGAARASVITETKAEALEAAREIAINQRLQVVIHGKDGRIQKRVTPQDAEDSDCFITTACVNFFHLKDNCYELSTLRRFRDNYLITFPEGESMVASYNQIAPIIVAALNSTKDRKRLYTEVFNQIKKSCRAIENNNFEKAIRIYKEAVLKLKNHLQIS